MSKFSFFSDLVNTLFDKKNRKKNFGSLFEKKQNKSLLEYIENVNDAKGEISALNYSEELLDYLSQCCLLYTSPSPRDNRTSRMPSSA